MEALIIGLLVFLIFLSATGFVLGIKAKEARKFKRRQNKFKRS